MNIPLIGLMFFFGAFIVNRFIMTNATKKLDDETKLKFFDVFPKRNNYSTIILFAIILLYFGAIQFLPQQITAVTGIYLAVFIVYLVASFILSYRKLKQIGTPTAYIKSFIIGYSIFLLGFLGLAISVMWSWLR